MGCREATQQVIFKPSQLNLEVVLLRGQLRLGKCTQNSSKLHIFPIRY